jgi:hypothetical protein
MYKVIELGSEFIETGEPRIRLLDSNLIKTASTNIQAFWDTLDSSDKYAYLWVIGVSAYEYYGCNNNGDAFHEFELKNNHGTFVANAHVFLHHVNKDPKKSIGKPLYSFYNDNMHRVELILRIDKSLPTAKKVIADLKNGVLICVSMGCRVKFDVCSICGNKAKTRAEYCTHAKYNMKKILPDGRKVMVFNPEPKFFDISIVNKPADQMAMTLDKIASEGDSGEVRLSAALGEAEELHTKKLAALDKLSDIIKNVDGVVSGVKDNEDDVNVFTRIDPEKLDYPILGFDEMEKMDVAPDQLLQAITSFGAPPSLGEISYAYGKHHFGDEYSPELNAKVFSMLPSAIRLLRVCGAPLEQMSYPLFRHRRSFDIPEMVMDQVAPVAKTRVIIIKQASDKAYLDKFANDLKEDLYQELTNPLPGEFPIPIKKRSKVVDKIAPYVSLRSSKGPGFYDQYTYSDPRGKEYKASRRSAEIAEEQTSTPRAIKKLVGAALGAAALGALFAEPDLVKKILTTTGLGLGAATLFNSPDRKTIVTNEGVEIPATTLFTEKVAAINTQFLKDNAGALIGMSIPAALGLDYFINSRTKYKGIQEPEQYLTGSKKTRYELGKTVADAPVLTAVTGGVVGASAKPFFNTVLEALKKKRV